jgi:hypothetical protein
MSLPLFLSLGDENVMTSSFYHRKMELCLENRAHTKTPVSSQPSKDLIAPPSRYGKVNVKVTAQRVDSPFTVALTSTSYSPGSTGVPPAAHLKTPASETQPLHLP